MQFEILVTKEDGDTYRTGERTSREEVEVQITTLNELLTQCGKEPLDARPIPVYRHGRHTYRVCTTYDNDSAHRSTVKMDLVDVTSKDVKKALDTLMALGFDGKDVCIYQKLENGWARI